MVRLEKIYSILMLVLLNTRINFYYECSEPRSKNISERHYESKRYPTHSHLKRSVDCSHSFIPSDTVPLLRPCANNILWLTMRSFGRLVIPCASFSSINDLILMFWQGFISNKPFPFTLIRIRYLSVNIEKIAGETELLLMTVYQWDGLIRWNCEHFRCWSHPCGTCVGLCIFHGTSGVFSKCARIEDHVLCFYSPRCLWWSLI